MGRVFTASIEESISAGPYTSTESGWSTKSPVCIYWDLKEREEMALTGSFL